MAQINDGRASENCEYPSFFGHQVLIRKFAELSFFVQGCHFKDSKWINVEKINGTLATRCINSGCRAERTDEISISHSGKAWWTEWMVTSYSGHSLKRAETSENNNNLWLLVPIFFSFFRFDWQFKIRC